MGQGKVRLSDGNWGAQSHWNERDRFRNCPRICGRHEHESDLGAYLSQAEKLHGGVRSG